MRILIVEDNPDDAELLLLELGRSSFEIVHERVQTAAQMNAALDGRPWDIVIADYSLPSFSGLAALSIIRKRGLDLPFILVSGNLGEETAVAAMKAGASDYLMKDRLARLVPVIERELREAETRRQRNKIQESLRHRDRQLAEAQRLAHVGSWHRNLVEGTAVWSDETYRIFGLEPAASPPAIETILALMHVDDRKLISGFLANGTSTQFEQDFRIQRSDGNLRYAHASVEIVRRSDGAVVELSGTVQDITDRKIAEESLRQAHHELEARVEERTHELSEANDSLKRQMEERLRAEESLRESEERFRQIAENTADIFWMASKDGRETIYVSPRYEQIWGRPREFLYAHPGSWAEAIHPDDQNSVRAAYSAITGTKTYDAEYRVVRPDGSIRWIHDRGSPVHDNSGEMYRIVGVAEDITERKTAEEALKKAMAMSEAASTAKSEFLANMSHEIRTPMTAILGYTDMLLDPRQSASDRIDCIHTIHRNSEHLLSVLNDILDLSKVEAGKLEIESIECDPCQTVNDVASLMRVRAIEKGIKFDVIFAGLLPQSVHTDPTRLRQILINLVGNAIKFTESGGVQLVVKLDDGEADRSMLRFDVIDSGIGISREQISQLFQPFAQGDSSTTRRFGGTGLGLTISKRLAVMLGGDIAVTSRSGRGSQFSLTIYPGELEGVRLLHQLGESIGRDTAPKSPVESVRLAGRVLLADDGIHNQRVISYYLRSAGVDVTTADNGKIACEKAMEAWKSGSPYDVILMDMQMPELDGYSAAATLRGKGYAGPIIAITAHAMAHDRAKCVQSGCSDYISKPIDRSLLLQMLGNLLSAENTAGATSSIAAEPTEVGRSEQINAPDPELAPFITSYVADLPAQVARLLQLARERDLQGMRAMVHQIKGTGGICGFGEINQSAAKVESALLAQDVFEDLESQVRGLADAMREVDGYDIDAELAKSRAGGDP